MITILYELGKLVVNHVLHNEHPVICVIMCKINNSSL